MSKYTPKMQLENRQQVARWGIHLVAEWATGESDTMHLDHLTDIEHARAEFPDAESLAEFYAGIHDGQILRTWIDAHGTTVTDFACFPHRMIGYVESDADLDDAPDPVADLREQALENARHAEDELGSALRQAKEYHLQQHNKGCQHQQRQPSPYPCEINFEKRR